MRISRIAVAVACLALFSLLPSLAFAQVQPPSEKLIIRTDHASTWNEGRSVVVHIDAPVTIEADRMTMTARAAVIWLTPSPGALLDERIVQIALVGDAQVDQPQQEVIRNGERLMVTLTVRGNIQLVAEQRDGIEQSNSDLFQTANRMRPFEVGVTGPAPRTWIAQPVLPPPTTRPTTQPRPREPVNFRAAHVDTTQTADDKTAFILSGGLTIYQRRANGDLIELQADRAVLFTQISGLRQLQAANRFDSAEDAIEAAYLEGDVRIAFTPNNAQRADQRLQAERVYYEFTSDRAILTQAVLHTADPQRQLPITVRAQTIRQLSVGEYRAGDSELSTSQFLTPTYSVRADRIYVRQEDTGDVRYGQQTSFVARDTSFHLFGVPFFYLPIVSGSMTERGSALRSIVVESSNRFGLGARTEWGLFETLGVLPPRDLDIGYNIDYFEKRGLALGLSADYRGGYITETTREPWDFQGDLRAYVINDHGDDRLGSQRAVVVPPDDIRGHIQWEHQHFFPDDWQVQLRAGYSSDPTFLEEYFERDFDTGLPHDLTAYLKRQRNTEAMTLLFQYPTNDFATTANELQEQVQVERLPEIGYRRIGDSFADDSLTFFSENVVGAYHFEETGATLLQQGFRAGQSPGIPSIAQTGTGDGTTYRGDLRQEIDYPLAMGQFKVVPYVVGRYTGYSDSPNGNSQDRVFVGAGLRVNTAFWRVDDTAQSDLFDIHRLRHVIEPEINFFTSAATRDRNDLFIYDEPIDAINDISAVQIALHQRWQTKRGGAGQFRSVDFLTINVEGNFFFNQPTDTIDEPRGFRGLFFNSHPEASLARNSINGDALWRVSDTTAVLADGQYNLDEQQLATTSIGFAVQRDPRLSYFIGTRYIGQINSTIANLAANYQLSSKYSLAFNQSFNLSERKSQDSSVTIIRHFDRLFVTLTLYHDEVNDESGFRVGIIPEGLGRGASSSSLSSVFGPQ